MQEQEYYKKSKKSVLTIGFITMILVISIFVIYVIIFGVQGAGVFFQQIWSPFSLNEKKSVEYFSVNEPNGVVIATSGDLEKLTETDDAFKRFIEAELRSVQRKEEMTCQGHTPAIDVLTVYDNRFALGGMEICQGRVRILWVQDGGRWSEADRTHQAADFHCKSLEQYKVPKRLVSAQCIDEGCQPLTFCNTLSVVLRAGRRMSLAA